jgi:hypothetical protein
VIKRWLQENANLLGASAAVLALGGVWAQIEASKNQQALQSARDAYRSHLSLSIEKPLFAAPSDVCQFIREENVAYDAFVAHLLYAAEQMLEQKPDWTEVFRRELAPHEAYICHYRSEFLTDGPLDEMLQEIVAVCPEKPICS